MPYNLLLLPWLGGYLFIHLNHWSRFHAQRLDGYRLLAESAIAGTVLAAIGRFLVVSTGRTRVGSMLGGLWWRFAPWQHSDTAAWALILGPILAVIINQLLGLEKAKDIEIRRSANSLLRLLYAAVKGERLVSITLDTRKWYVGYVAESPNLDPAEMYFRLLPVMSGYREHDTLKTYRTVLYEDVISGSALDSEDFVITLPLKDIKSGNFFDEDVYEKHFASDDEKPTDVDEAGREASGSEGEFLPIEEIPESEKPS